MNDAITLALRVALVIPHFLCFSSVTAIHNQQETYLEIQKDYFANNYRETVDDTVKGWLTHDPSLRQRNLVEEFWLLDHQPVSSLQTFLSHNPQRRSKVSKTSRTPVERAQLCDFGESQSNFQLLSNTSARKNYGDGNYSETPPGCRFHDENQTLICDGLASLPSQLPRKLQLFELNNSQVRVIPRSAFGTSEIKTVRIHGNELLCMHPNAFDGVTGLKILSISNNNELEYIRLEDFQNLTEVYMLYLEHNQINLVNYPRFNWAADYGSNNVAADDDSTAVLPSLMWLSLMGNPLEILPRDYFYPLRNSPVIYLKLTNCQIHFVQPGKPKSDRSRNL